MKIITEIIKEARIKKNWTQERLAKELGIIQPYFSKLESSTVPPSDNLCVKIAKKLGLNKKTFLLQVRKQRNSSAISKYLLSFPVEKIPREVKEFLIIYETLDNSDKNKMKNILSLMTECANKHVHF
ncbi:XRE family transcriptional regulator [bacterium]|nr:MAG: XRE family transcriptional regulator [bacterium]